MGKILAAVVAAALLVFAFDHAAASQAATITPGTSVSQTSVSPAATALLETSVSCGDATFKVRYERSTITPSLVRPTQVWPVTPAFKLPGVAGIKINGVSWVDYSTGGWTSVNYAFADTFNFQGRTEYWGFPNCTSPRKNVT